MNENASAWDVDDVALLDRVVRDQDADAYRALFDRYYARVFLFVRRRIEDRELAAEVTSDVFFEVWSSAAAFRGESRVSSWIFGIARFKSLEAVRRMGRLKRSRVVATDDETLARFGQDDHVTEQLIARQDLDRVGRALERLPDTQREALELCVVDGLAIDEVARRQSVSSDTVKTRVSRARKGLRRMLGDPGGRST